MPGEIDRHAELKRLFLRALELSGNERDRFVEGACAANPGLGEELASLLSHSRPADLPPQFRRPG